MNDIDNNQDAPKQYDEQAPEKVLVNNEDRSSSAPMRRLTRLIVGAALIGGEGFSKALKTAQEKVETSPGFTTPEKSEEDESEIDHMRYFLLGSFYQAQKQAMRGVRHGFNFSLRTSGAILGTFYAVTDNSLLRPMQKPVDYILSNAAREADQVLRVGRYEEMQSKAMAQETTSELVDEMIDSVVNNPKFTKAIQDVVGSQSLGMMQMILDSVTGTIAKVDYIVEGIIRRIFHLTLRKNLPESPIVGQPQFMYLPAKYNPNADDESKD